MDACYGGLSLLRAQAPPVIDRRYLELVGRSRVMPESLALSRHTGSHPLTRVRIADRAVGFVAAGSPEDLAIDGELSRNGRALTGATRAGGFTYELRLQRK